MKVSYHILFNKEVTQKSQELTKRDYKGSGCFQASNSNPKANIDFFLLQNISHCE